MPLYEYHCSDCESDFERIVFASDKDPVECPHCSATNTERLLSVFSANPGKGDGSMGSSCGAPSGGFS